MNIVHSVPTSQYFSMYCILLLIFASACSKQNGAEGVVAAKAGSLDHQENTVIVGNNESMTALPRNLTLQEGAILSLSLGDNSNGVHEVIIVDAPTLGTLSTGSQPGDFIYVPSAHVSGSDQFSYKYVAGKEESNVALINIQILPVNDAPSAVDLSWTILEDNVIRGKLMGFDVDSDVLSYRITKKPVSGSINLENLTTGEIVYTPNKNANGVDSFMYMVSDGTLESNAATVTVTITPVNDAPVAVDDNVGVMEGQSTTLSNLLKNDTDVDGDTLAVSAFTQATSGTITKTTVGDLVYTPKQYFSGNDAFMYTVSDGHGGTALGMVYVTVKGINHLPIAVADSVTTNRDTSTVVNVLNNDVSLIDLPVVLSVATLPVNGNVKINADNSMTYTPVLSFVGTDSFTYRITDNTGDESIAAVQVTVLCGIPCTHTVQLDWTPNAETNISGYYVYHGTASGTYIDKIWVPNSTSSQFSTAVSGNHFFALSAVNNLNSESALSAEGVIAIP